jgi:predicted amidohydrolase
MHEPTKNDSLTVRVAAVQMAPALGQIEHNLCAVLKWLRRAADAGARLVVFPECALTGYVYESRAEALEKAEPLPGPSTERIARACAEHDVWVIVGLLEREGDRLYNACALIGPMGPIGLIGHIAIYRKVHLPHMGVDRYADAGDRPFALCEAEGLRIGMHICYDGAFPEAGRVLSLMGADLLVLPTNWPAGAEPLAEHMMACRALENVVYAMAVDRVGSERGTRFIGRSGIYDPLGRTLARAGPEVEEILYAEIDPARARNKQIVREPGRAFCDRMADRRPEFYRLPGQ